METHDGRHIMDKRTLVNVILQSEQYGPINKEEVQVPLHRIVRQKGIAVLANRAREEVRVRNVYFGLSAACTQ